MPRTIVQPTGPNKNPQKNQEAFLTAFCELGNISKAAKKAKVGRQTVYDWLENDADFKKKYKKARKIAAGVLEDEAHRRAVEGCNKPVWYKGQKVGTVKEYSDTLLVQLLKANLPKKYRERVQSQLTGPDGGPIKTESTVLILPSNGREIIKPDGNK